MDPLPDPQNTFSTLAEVTWAPQQLKGWAGTAALALDLSPRLGNNVGVEVGIKKTLFSTKNEKLRASHNEK